MKLNRIEGLNIKGRNIAADFEPLTIIAGPNAGGKTSVRQAITLAALGHLPNLGKRPSAAAVLRTEGMDLMDIRATFDAGTITRTWKKTKMTTAGEPDLSELIHPAQLDFDVFAQAKATERQRIIEGLMASTNSNEYRGQATLKIADAALDIDLDAGDDWIRTLEGDAKEAALMAKQEADTAAKTILQLSIDDDAPTFDAEAYDVAASRLAEAQERLGTAREKAVELQRRHAKTPDEPDQDRPTKERLDKLTKDVEAQASKEAALAAEFHEARIAISKADVLVERIPAGITPQENPEVTDALKPVIEPLKDAAQATWKTMSEKDTAAKTANDQLREIEGKIDRLKELGECPTCGTHGDELADTVTEILIPIREDREAAAKKALADYQAAVDDHNAANLAKADADILIRKLAEREAWELIQKTDEIRSKGRDVGERLERERQILDNLKTTRTQALQLDAAWKEFDAADPVSKADIEVAVERLEAAKADVERITGQLGEMRQAKAKADAYLETVRKKSDLEAAVEKSAKTQKGAKALADWAKAISLEVTLKALRPILGVANELLKGLVPGDLSIRGTDVGVTVGETFRPLEILSGSEAAAIGASIQAAIASKSDWPVILIDEFARFDRDRRPELLRNLDCMLADGVIDQAIVFTHDTTGVEDWPIVTV